MKIFVGDLHIGKGNGAEDFSPHAEGAFIRFLDRPEPIYFAGDTLETWEADEEDIYMAHQGLFVEFLTRQERLHFIPGNHDSDLSWLAQAGYSIKPDMFVVNGNTLVLHGHQFDWANKTGAGLGKIVTQVVGWMERRGWETVDDSLSWLWNTITLRLEKYERGIAAMAKSVGCTQAIYSHTHYPRIKVVDGIKVANCGTWTHRFERGYPYVQLTSHALTLRWWR